jgi:hypothetical protein
VRRPVRFRPSDGFEKPEQEGHEGNEGHEERQGKKRIERIERIRTDSCCAEQINKRL